MDVKVSFILTNNISNALVFTFQKSCSDKAWHGESCLLGQFDKILPVEGTTKPFTYIEAQQHITLIDIDILHC